MQTISALEAGRRAGLAMIFQQKIKECIDLYLQHIEEITSEVHVREEEGYKFKSVD